MKLKHFDDCARSCKAAERGVIVSQDTDPNGDGKWYAYYAHDTQGDGEWLGSAPQVLTDGHDTEAQATSAAAQIVYTPETATGPDWLECTPQERREIEQSLQLQHGNGDF